MLASVRSAEGSFVLEASDGRTSHDFDFDGDFNDGISSPTASSLIFLSNGTRAARAGFNSYDTAGIFPGTQIESAYLRMSFSIARDFNKGPYSSEPTFSSPDAELYGYVGDGWLGWVMGGGRNADRCEDRGNSDPTQPVAMACSLISPVGAGGGFEQPASPAVHAAAVQTTIFPVSKRTVRTLCTAFGDLARNDDLSQTCDREHRTP